MKKNPVIPFALIASLGIIAMIVLSMVGLNQQEQIANGGDHTGETTLAEPEEIAQSCIGCHGTDLAGGGAAPSLQQVGSKYTEEEILNIIKNGIEGTSMPPMVPTISNEEAAVLATWLAEKQ